MNRPFVSLRPEITRTHALTLMDWLEDERVTRYLSDSRGVSRIIEQAIDRTQMPILTHLFNQSGRFYMAHDRNDIPVGFVRLAKTGPDWEIVLVIGDHENWSRGLGSSTICEGLKLAFFDLRAERVIAKIHPDNTRSLKAFQRCGFLPVRETSTLNSLSMTAGRYFQLLRGGAMQNGPVILITEMDKARLQDLIELERGPAIIELKHEIERAKVIGSQHVTKDVVTMNSRVAVQFAGEEREVELVYPQDADESSGRHSVLSDIGAAILGYREGDVIDWMVSGHPQRIAIQTVVYQPEASGEFHL